MEARLTMSLAYRPSCQTKTVPDPLRGKKNKAKALNLPEEFPKRKQLGFKLNASGTGIDELKILL